MLLHRGVLPFEEPERAMMTWHDFVVQLLLIVAPAAILTLIQINRRR
jgi:hypothetical protein